MSNIPLDAIEEASMEVMERAAVEIPKDYKDAVNDLSQMETGNLSCFVLKTMLDNWEVAHNDKRPICADTGLPRYFIKIGEKANISSFIELERILRKAVANKTESLPLRPNRVHPLWRTDHNNNVGLNAPEIDWSFEPDADWIDITSVHKGGLFGTDYRMLFPGDGITGIKKFMLDTLVAYGKRGLQCQPVIMGVGVGGSKDACMQLGKQAACLRIVGDRNPDPKIAALEKEFMDIGNSLGMGAMGFSGKGMVIDCHIECGYTHTGGMPTSIHTFCLSSRRATARVFSDGTIEYRTDPKWFTPYMRRETVGWKQPETVEI